MSVPDTRPIDHEVHQMVLELWRRLHPVPTTLRLTSALPAKSKEGGNRKQRRAEAAKQRRA